MKKCGVGENDFGRSMIEMLGVLAIVGVLSIGGITGYQKAMTRYKVNKWTEDVALILQNFLKYSDDWKRIAKKEGAYTSVGRIAFNAGLFPSGWFLKDDVSNWAYNNLNSAILLSASPYNEVYLTIRLKTGTNTAKEQCRTFFTQVLIPWSERIRDVHRYNSDDQAQNRKNEEHYKGNAYCTTNNRCLKNFKLSDILNACRDEPEDGTRLIFSVYFK